MNQNVNHLFACFHYLITLLSFVSCFGFISVARLSTTTKNIEAKRNSRFNEDWRWKYKVATHKKEWNSRKILRKCHTFEYFDALFDESLNKNITPVIQSLNDKMNAKLKFNNNRTETEMNKKNYMYKIFKTVSFLPPWLSLPSLGK